MVEQDRASLADDLVTGSRYRRSLLRGVLCYRVVGGVAPIVAIVAGYGLSGTVLVLIASWLAVVAVSVALWRLVQRRHLVHPRPVLFVLLVDALAGVGLNLLTTLIVPGSIQDSWGVVFWFCAQANVAAWTFLRPALAVPAILAWTGVASVMVVADPDRPLPVGALAEGGFVVLHLLWLLLACLALIVCGRLIRLGSSTALSDGVQLGRRAAQVQALRDTHDTVLQTLEAIALRASDTRSDPADELRAVADMARVQAADLRQSLHQHTRDDDIRSMLIDLRQRFADRLDVELDFLDSARVAHAPVEVWAALRGAVHECLTNVVKHAGVRQAFVEVDRTSVAIRVTVRDHGRGFVPDRTALGFGLTQSITQRLEEVGGWVDVSSVPGGGAVVSLTAPLAHGAAASTVNTPPVDATARRPLTNRV